ALCGKVSTAYEGEATAAKFYNVFRKQLQFIPNISSEVQGARLLEDEEEQSAKGKIETIDDENKVITFSLFDGDVSENYKSFKGTLQVMDGEYGGLVRWS
ncbi:hypothetical protein KIW84_061204, partial [Lathyrus oleraceus]